MTLLETLIWAALSLMVVIAAYTMLNQVLRITRRENDRSQAHLAEMRAFSWLIEDLHFANGAGVVWRQGPGQPTFLSIHPQDRSLQQQARFAPELVLYEWRPASGKLWRGRVLSPPATFRPETALRPEHTELETWSADARVSKRLLADGVVRFDLQNVKLYATDPDLPGGAIARNFQVTLEIYSPDGQQKFSQQRTLSVRASL